MIFKTTIRDFELLLLCDFSERFFRKRKISRRSQSVYVEKRFTPGPDLNDIFGKGNVGKVLGKVSL
jgi:hypothetical protein